MRYHKSFDHWCVIYSGTARRYFRSREAAIAEAVAHGLGIRAPLYSDA
jgi:hypothetical protein